MLSTATHEDSASIFSLRETSNLHSMYSGGGIIPNTVQPENLAIKVAARQRHYLIRAKSTRYTVISGCGSICR